MVASTIEKPQYKKSFTDLMHLRKELTKETKNQERLAEFQKTIDRALERGEKKGIIEFTENEWKSLIADENLPPIEEVQKLLTEKIASAKEVSAETKEKTGGIMEELKKKAENLTEGAKKKVEELATKAEGLKKYSKPALWFLGIGLSLKIWGYKIANWFSGLFGKKGEYDEKIKLAEMEREFLKNPEEAVKKYGEESLGKVKEKVSEKTEEAKEGILEKVGPLAALGVAGTGIFALLKGKLPTKMANSLSGLDQKSLLGKLARNRALRLFGVGGVALFGIGKLYEYIENNSATLGEMPTDAEGKKAWWKRALENAGIGAKEGSEEIWSVLNGEKVEEYFEEKGPRPGYQFLENSDLLRDVKGRIRLLADKLELIYKKDPKKFEAAFIGMGIFQPGIILGMAGAGKKGLDLVRTVFRALYGSAKNHPLLWSLEIAMLGSEVEGIKHIQVPEEMTLETLTETIGDIVSMDHINGKLNDMAPGFVPDSIQKTAEYLENNCAKITAEIEYLYTHWQEKLDAGLRNLLVTEEKEKITKTDKIGLEAFQKDLHIALGENKVNNIESLIGPDRKSGIIGQLITKVSYQETITEEDIHNLIAATEGTKIRIIPEGGTSEGKTIQWVLLDTNCNPDGPAKNICINPLKEQDEKVMIANNFIYDPTSLGFLSKLGHEAYNTGRDLISDITKSITSEPGKAKSSVEKLLGLGASIGCFGGKMFIEYLNQVYIVGPANLISSIIPGGKGFTGQEFLVEYAGGIVPVSIISGINRGLLGRGGGVLGEGIGKLGWKVILETALYPIKGPADIGKFMYDKYNKGLLKDILKDPAVLIRDQFYRYAGKIPGAPKAIKEIRELVHIKEDLSRIHEKLKKAQRMKLGLIPEAEIEKVVKEARAIFENGKVTKHFPGIDLMTFNATKIDDLAKMSGEGISSCTKEINHLRGKGDKSARNHVSENPESLKKTPNRSEKATLDPTNPNHKKMMDDFMGKSRSKLQLIEEERARAGKLLKENKITSAEYDQKMKVWSQREGKIMRLQEAIHLKLHGTPLHGTKKLGRFARGLGGLVLTIGAVVGAQMAIEKWKTDDTDIPLPELDNESDEEGENEDGFYGFGDKESDKKKVESNEKGTEKIPENIKPFLEKVESITAQYQLSFFCDAEGIAKADDATIEKNIQLIEDGHDGLVARMKSLLREYREPLKKYWAELKKEGTAINIKSENLGHLNAFMAITEKKDGLYLESMNKIDVSETLWGIVDGVKNGGIGQRILETGMGLLPITSEIQDMQFAYREFSRGHIGDGFVHVGFFFLDTVLDVASLAAGVVTAPAAGAGGVAVGAGAIGIRGALKQGAKWVAKKAIKGLKFEKIQGFVRVIGESEKFQKHMTPWLSGIRGKALRLPSGDLINAGIDLPRSDSIKIDQL